MKRMCCGTSIYSSELCAERLRYAPLALPARLRRAGDALRLQAQLPALVRGLLEERFKLVVRHEQREQTIYVLRLVNKDGSLGSRLKRSAECGQNTGGCAPRVTPGHITGRSIPIIQ